MIYDVPELEDPIRQGDIFRDLPKVEMSLRRVPVLVGENQQELRSWKDLVSAGEPVSIVVAARPVFAIVASQDCDAVNGRDITLCEIRPFRDVERLSKDTSAPTAWMKIITQQAKRNLKWFYLPPDSRLGFSNKMGVDFMVTLRVPRTELEELRNLRVGRLNALGDEHFRERISEFYRRYPYDEWYPLDPAELDAYQKEHPATSPFPWQHS